MQRFSICSSNAVPTQGDSGEIPYDLIVPGTVPQQSYDMSNVGKRGGDHRRLVRAMPGYAIVVKDIAHGSKRNAHEREQHLLSALDLNREDETGRTEPFFRAERCSWKHADTILTGYDGCSRVAQGIVQRVHLMRSVGHM